MLEKRTKIYSILSVDTLLSFVRGIFAHRTCLPQIPWASVPQLSGQKILLIIHPTHHQTNILQSEYSLPIDKVAKNVDSNTKYSFSKFVPFFQIYELFRFE